MEGVDLHSFDVYIVIGCLWAWNLLQIFLLSFMRSHFIESQWQELATTEKTAYRKLVVKNDKLSMLVDKTLVKLVIKQLQQVMHKGS